MPLSNDNQDYGKKDKINEEKNLKEGPEGSENKLNTDDLKGKKVDADLDKPEDKPSEQKK